MVVIHHLVGRTSISEISEKGYLGVSIFFVLSGFVITMSIGERQITLGFLGRFAARRALRLDIPYWASILVAIILMYLATKIGVPKEFPNTPQILVHLVYLQDILGYKQISEIYWTLCLEIQFYLFLILFLWVGKQRVESISFQFTLVALLVLSLIESANILDLTPTGSFLPYWYGFSTGAITYWAIIGRLKSSILIGALALLLGFSPFDHGDALIVTIFTGCVLYIAYYSHKMEVWLKNPFMQFLGRISYSLYLFHPLIGWTAQSLALKFFNEWIALITGIGASIISAWITYLILERPAIRWSRSINLGN